MTLAECIARYNESQAKPLNQRTSVLTPLGTAVVAARRFTDALAALSADERTALVMQTIVGMEGPVSVYTLLISRPPTRSQQTA